MKDSFSQRRLVRLALGGLEAMATVAVIVTCFVFVWTVWSRPSAAQTRVSEVATQDIDAVIPAAVIPANALTHARGRAAFAPLVLIEFVDFQCAFCANFARETLPQLQEGLISRNALEFVAVNFPRVERHAQAFQAAEAAECAGRQEHYWEMHDLLFDDPGQLSQTDFLANAAKIGLDVAAFETCLAGEAAEKVRADISLGTSLGVTDTPAFFLGHRNEDGAVTVVRRIHGETSYAALIAEIDTVRQALPRFEVASVKPSARRSEPPRLGPRLGPGQFTITATLEALVRMAYRIPRGHLIVGSPSWIKSERFEIIAKYPDGIGTAGPVRLTQEMLRALLEERFGLVARIEPREQPVYALVRTRRDGRLGPRMERTTSECSRALPGQEEPLCGDREVREQGANGDVVTTRKFGHSRIERLVAFLTFYAQRPVVDRTGLAGAFNLELTFAPNGPPLDSGVPRSAPSLFLALEEQLGLKLEPVTAPMEVLVIDQIERPAPN